MAFSDQFRHVDARKTPGLYVKFERKIIVDEIQRVPDWLGEGDETDEHRAETAARKNQFERGDLWLVGVRAVAHIQHVHKGGHSTLYRIESAGLWGIESDSGEDYLDDVFRGECDELRGLFAAMRESGGPVEEPNAKG